MAFKRENMLVSRYLQYADSIAANDIFALKKVMTDIKVQCMCRV